MGHSQLVLRLSGATSKPVSGFRVDVEVLINGALWRSQSHPLCVLAGQEISKEFRTCQDTVGEFSAEAYVFLPRWLPQLPKGGDDFAKMRSLTSDQQRIEFANELMNKLQLCEDVCQGKACIPGTDCKRTGPANFLKAREGYMSNLGGPGASGGAGQNNRADWVSLAASFIVAAMTLPQPFTVVENGNLCGGITIVIAAVKKRYCPTCPFITVDPGVARPNFNCTMDNLNKFGLAGQVTSINDLSATIITDFPIGFMYYDDGKDRPSNMPLVSMLEKRVMTGALIAHDDAWQGHPIDYKAGKLLQHYGQMMTVLELIESRLYQPYMVPVNPKYEDCMQAPPAIQQVLDKLVSRAPMPSFFLTRKTVVVKRVRSALTGEKKPLALELRITITDGDGEPQVVKHLPLDRPNGLNVYADGPLVTGDAQHMYPYSRGG